MDYERIYDQLIEKRRTNPITKKDCYCEKHHIVPRSLGGINDDENLINLTAREHYMAHRFLVKIMEKKYGRSSKEYEKMACALWRFMYSNEKHEKVSSRQYEILKNIFGKVQSERMTGENNPMYGRTGEKSPMYGKSCLDFMTPEKIEKWRNGNSEHHKGKIPWCKGKKFTEEEKKKYHLTGPHTILRGKDNPMYGKPCFYKMTPEQKEAWRKHVGEASKGRKKTPEEIEKLRKANTGKFVSEETKQKIRDHHANLKGWKHMYHPQTLKNTLIPPEKVDEYLAMGYVLGQYKSNKSV